MAQQDDFDYLLASGDIHAYVRYLLTLYPSGHHLRDLGLRVDQWLQLCDLIDHELFMGEITINGGGKGSNAIEARTSSNANWNTSTTLDRNRSKHAPVLDLHPTNQTPIIIGEPIKVFALTQRSESAASSINQDNGKMPAPASKEGTSDPYKTDGKGPTEPKRKLRDKYNQNVKLKSQVSALKRQLKPQTDEAKKKNRMQESELRLPLNSTCVYPVTEM